MKSPLEFKAVRECVGSNMIDTPPAVRQLKIEATGDFWQGLIKPKIRLTGRWLEQAGFKPGNRVQVICVSPGVIELRTYP
jgi:cell division inhibitor SulA